MALQGDSPAIDFGTAEGAPLIDQRGLARPFGSGVDIGAYEWTQIAAPRLTSTLNAEGHLQISFQAASQTSYELQSSTNLSDWTTIATIPASPQSTVISREFQTTGDQTFYKLLIKDEPSTSFAGTSRF